MKDRNVLLIGLAALVALLVAAFVLVPVVSEPKTVTIDYGPLIDAVDPELEGEIAVTQGGPHDNYQFRLATFKDDGVTPKVYKDLLKPEYINIKGDYGIGIRYSYFREDGTLARTKSIAPVPQFGASCLHKFVHHEYSADGKNEVSAVYLRENGDVAATMENGPDTPEVWKHYRVDRSLAHIQETTEKGYRYIHFRKNGKDVWWTFDKTYSKTDESAVGTVHFDWDGNVFEKKFNRHSLYKDGYSIGNDSPPFPIHEDSYLREDGTVEYRQTWVAMYRDDEGFEALSKLEIFSADGKRVERVITFEPQHTSKGYAVKSDVMTSGQTPPSMSLLPRSMFHGFNVEIWSWTHEYKHDK